MRHLVLACSLSFALVLGIGCGDSPTSPTTTDTTTPTTTAATPIYNEEWIDTLAVGDERFYSFTVTQYGTVNVAFSSVTGQYVPGTVTLGLGLGVPSAETCTTSTYISTQAGTGPHISGTYNPGVYCVVVRDVGNLFSSARFAITIDYP